MSDTRQFTNGPERRRVLDQALSATSLAEIDAAVRALKAWVKDHPADRGIVDAFEQLAMMREIAEQEEAPAALAATAPAQEAAAGTVSASPEAR